MIVVVFQELGTVVKDMDYDRYLPNLMTKSATSTKLVMNRTGLQHPVQARQYMLETSERLQITALVFENCLCKIQFAWAAKC